MKLRPSSIPTEAAAPGAVGNPTRVWRWRLRPLLLLPLIVMLSACSGALPGQQDPELASEIRSLQRRVLELEKQSRVNQVELSRLRLRVAELEARRGGASAGRAPSETAPSRPSGYDSQPPAAPPRSYDSDPLEEEDLDAVSYGQPAASPSATSPSASDLASRPAASPSADGSASAGGSAQELYDRGYTLYHQGRFLDAESTFQQYLQQHTDTDLADNAQYWIGESRYARKDFQGALSAFVETVDRYPQGNKVPAALLKAGQCLEELGDLDTARETYQQLIERFPNSASTVTAQEHLAALR